MAEAEAPRVGAWLPVLVEQVVNDTLVVTLRCGERRFAGVLLDCSKKYGGTRGGRDGEPCRRCAAGTKRRGVPGPPSRHVLPAAACGGAERRRETPPEPLPPRPWAPHPVSLAGPGRPCARAVRRPARRARPRRGCGGHGRTSVGSGSAAAQDGYPAPSGPAPCRRPAEVTPSRPAGRAAPPRAFPQRRSGVPRSWGCGGAFG